MNQKNRILSNNIPTQNSGKDITKRFKKCCQSCLTEGDIAHETYFGLQHAMSAIEIMNPSMDVGMPKKRKVLFLHESVESDSLPLECFTDMKLLLGVIDELLVSFVNWVTGDLLVQSVFTCLYMHCIPMIKDPKLSLFCEVLRRCIIQLRSLLVTSAVFEEEDFCAMTYGVPLCCDTSLYFENKSPANKLYLYSQTELLNLISHINDEFSNSEDPILTSISSRFHFLTSLFSMFSEILPVLLKGENDLDDYNDIPDSAGFGPPQVFSNSITPTIADLSLDDFQTACQVVVKSTLELTQVCQYMEQTSNLGISAGPGKTSPRDYAYDLPGFEPFLTQAYMPSTVQRFSKNLERNVAFSYLTCAFTRIHNVISKLISVVSNNDQCYVSFQELWALLHNFGHNCCHSVCIIKTEVIATTNDNPDAKTCLLSRGFLNAFVFTVLQCQLKIEEHISDNLITSRPALHFIFSWLSIECELTRKSLLDNLPTLERFGTFFEHVGSQLLTISRGYCFNRSRQRSNMERIFSRMHELLEDSYSIESAISLGLVDNQLSNQPTLHLAAYVCFFYYHLAWDYVGTGFQLELYSCHEWVYMYSFIINILRSLSNLLQHITKETDQQSPSKEGAATTSIDTTKSTSANKQLGKRRRRKVGKESPVTSELQQKELLVDTTIVKYSSASLSIPSVDMLYWKYQLILANIHRFMSAGTVYIIRALQREVGIDLNDLNKPPSTTMSVTPFSPSRRKFYGSLQHQFLYRLGVLIGSQASPLAEVGGGLALFTSTHEYLVSRPFVDCPTMDLYQLASKIYGVARHWIGQANQVLNELRQAPRNGIYSNICPPGPIDSLGQLDHVAKNNDVVSRLLALRPEKRSRVDQLPADRMPDLRSPHLSVQLDFSQLPSKMYPLLKLIN